MIAQRDLQRIPILLARKTRSREIAEDAMQDAIVKILERGESLTPARVHHFAKLISLEIIRDQDKERAALSEYTRQRMTDSLDLAFVSAKRKFGRSTFRNGGVPELDELDCPFCDRVFKPFSKNGRKQRTCGTASCVTRLGEQTKRERRLSAAV